jgi:hypothetical protein
MTSDDDRRFIVTFEDEDKVLPVIFSDDRLALT